MTDVLLYGYLSLAGLAVVAALINQIKEWMGR
jgi:hypothetical protein